MGFEPGPDDRPTPTPPAPVPPAPSGYQGPDGGYTAPQQKTNGFAIASLVFGIIVIPITFLGATYYPWVRLTPIPWLKAFVLVNPLVYMSEAFRTALTVGIPHMPTIAIYAALVGFTALLAWLGIAGFRKRVLT